MPRINLDRKWFHRGQFYGPGEADVPEGLARALARQGPVRTVLPGNAAPLPPDFPHRERLVALGITTREALAEIDDLTALDGIGEARAADIAAALDQ